MDNNNNRPLRDRVFNYVTNWQTLKKLKNDDVSKEIFNEIVLLPIEELREMINDFFERLKNTKKYLKETAMYETLGRHDAEMDLNTQRAIQKSVIYFYRAATKFLPEGIFDEIISDLIVYSEFLIDSEIKEIIFKFLIRQNSEQALKFCIKFIQDSIDFDRHRTNIFHNHITTLAQESPLIENVLTYILKLSPYIFENIEPRHHPEIITRFRGYYYELIKRKFSIGRELVHTYIKTEGETKKAIAKAIAQTGRFPERETNVVRTLLEYLISDDLPAALQDEILALIKSIHIDPKNNDKASILNLIIEQAQSMSGLKKPPLQQILNALFQLIGEPSPQWREAVDIISTKLSYDVDFAKQKIYIQTKLREYGLDPIEVDFERFMKSCERDNQPALETLRKVYEGIARFLINKVKEQWVKNPMKQNFIHLEGKSILTATAEPSLPDTKKAGAHKEVAYSEDLWGLLSHYGSHPNPTDELKFTLFISTLSWIYLLLKRYEKTTSAKSVVK